MKTETSWFLLRNSNNKFQKTKNEPTNFHFWDNSWSSPNEIFHICNHPTLVKFFSFFSNHATDDDQNLYNSFFYQIRTFWFEKIHAIRDLEVNEILIFYHIFAGFSATIKLRIIKNIAPLFSKCDGGPMVHDTGILI